MKVADVPNNSYEIVVAGGGSAGAVLASRPSANPDRRVLLLGGGSAVNAVVAMRARPADFARWTARGIEGRSIDAVQEVVSPYPLNVVDGRRVNIPSVATNVLTIMMPKSSVDDLSTTSWLSVVGKEQ